MIADGNSKQLLDNVTHMLELQDNDSRNELLQTLIDEFEENIVRHTLCAYIDYLSDRGFELLEQDYKTSSRQFREWMKPMSNLVSFTPTLIAHKFDVPPEEPPATAKLSSEATNFKEYTFDNRRIANAFDCYIQVLQFLGRENEADLVLKKLSDIKSLQQGTKTEIRSKNGTVYTGQTDEKGNRHGTGRLETNKGDIYQGHFQSGLRHGKGTCWYKNGERYEGDWENDLRHGEGTQFRKNGYVLYKGGWANGKRNGLGTSYNTQNKETTAYWLDNRIDTPVTTKTQSDSHNNNPPQNSIISDTKEPDYEYSRSYEDLYNYLSQETDLSNNAIVGGIRFLKTRSKNMTHSEQGILYLPHEQAKELLEDFYIQVTTAPQYMLGPFIDFITQCPPVTETSGLDEAKRNALELSNQENITLLSKQDLERIKEVYCNTLVRQRSRYKNKNLSFDSLKLSNHPRIQELFKNPVLKEESFLAAICSQFSKVLYSQDLPFDPNYPPDLYSTELEHEALHKILENLQELKSTHEDDINKIKALGSNIEEVLTLEDPVDKIMDVMNARLSITNSPDLSNVIAISQQLAAYYNVRLGKLFVPYIPVSMFDAIPLTQYEPGAWDFIRYVVLGERSTCSEHLTKLDINYISDFLKPESQIKLGLLSDSHLRLISDGLTTIKDILESNDPIQELFAFSRLNTRPDRDQDLILNYVTANEDLWQIKNDNFNNSHRCQYESPETASSQDTQSRKNALSNCRVEFLHSTAPNKVRIYLIGLITRQKLNSPNSEEMQISIAEFANELKIDHRRLRLGYLLNEQLYCADPYIPSALHEHGAYCINGSNITKPITAGDNDYKLGFELRTQITTILKESPFIRKEQFMETLMYREKWQKSDRVHESEIEVIYKQILNQHFIEEIPGTMAEKHKHGIYLISSSDYDDETLVLISTILYDLTRAVGHATPIWRIIDVLAMSRKNSTLNSDPMPNIENLLKKNDVFIEIQPNWWFIDKLYAPNIDAIDVPTDLKTSAMTTLSRLQTKKLLLHTINTFEIEHIPLQSILKKMNDIRFVIDEKGQPYAFHFKDSSNLPKVESSEEILRYDFKWRTDIKYWLDRLLEGKQFPAIEYPTPNTLSKTEYFENELTKTDQSALLDANSELHSHLWRTILASPQTQHTREEIEHLSDTQIGILDASSLTKAITKLKARKFINQITGNTDLYVTVPPAEDEIQVLETKWQYLDAAVESDQKSFEFLFYNYATD